ncbi:hypothetical protein AX774_g2213 [Zancudomyces culisetae]|uniref:ADP-ribosylation factor GTPase-activating protein GCS1 n=1 Tax=Zancudomyces culisetae TaxID=1213189 RepID=A0A1R1PTH9_ZANCU|nr:hypothetical protein AX774_g2213 [Zancudomyces culisetae]|eukprot:OMH84268.1 hypothetical protein AX774_g2213 [Zancudomyces culisetae]
MHGLRIPKSPVGLRDPWHFLLSKLLWNASRIGRASKLGGNKKALGFFQSQPDYREGMSIKEKYTSRFADLWRQKLTAECEGRSWTAPPQSVSPMSSRPGTPNYSTGARRATALGATTTGTTAMGGMSGSARGYGSKPTIPHRGINDSSLHRSNSSPGVGMVGIGESGDDYGREEGVVKTNKEIREDYFSRLGKLNQERREDLPPSQGGRYTGFGSGGQFNSSGSGSSGNGSGGRFDPKEIVEDPGAALSKGWSMLTMGAMSAMDTLGSMAGTLNQNYIKPATEKVLDPEFRTGVVGYVSEIGKKVEEQANKGFHEISRIARPYQGYSNYPDAHGSGNTNTGGYGNADSFGSNTNTSSSANRNANTNSSNNNNKGGEKKSDWDDEWDNF